MNPHLTRHTAPTSGNTYWVCMLPGYHRTKGWGYTMQAAFKAHVLLETRTRESDQARYRLAS
jgi:hypothetical protein